MAQVFLMAFQSGDRRERAFQLLRGDLSQRVMPRGEPNAGVVVADDLDDEVWESGRADSGYAIRPVEDNEALIGAGWGHDRRVAQESRRAQTGGERFGPPLILLLVGDEEIHRDETKIGKAETGRIRVGHGEG